MAEKTRVHVRCYAASFRFSVVGFQLVGIGAEWRGLVAFVWSDLDGSTVREGPAPNVVDG